MATLRTYQHFHWKFSYIFWFCRHRKENTWLECELKLSTASYNCYKIPLSTDLMNWRADYIHWTLLLLAGTLSETTTDYWRLAHRFVWPVLQISWYTLSPHTLPPKLSKRVCVRLWWWGRVTRGLGHGMGRGILRLQGRGWIKNILRHIIGYEIVLWGVSVFC